MSHTARLKRPPAAFRQLTGITRAAFDRLRADLEPRYAAADPASDPGAEAVLRREKKRHAVERHVAVTRRRKKPGPGAKPRRVRIAAVSGAFPGKPHDEKVYDQARVVAPPGVKRTGDAGYVGTALEAPTKRPPKGTSTARQKAGNRRVSRRRIVVEHGIGKMKVWRIPAAVADILGVAVRSMHTDLSTRTGERVVVFALDGRPAAIGG